MNALKNLWAKLVPTFLKGKEKAVAAFLVPVILAQLAHFVPGVEVDPSILEQVIAAVLVSVSVWSTNNTGA